MDKLYSLRIRTYKKLNQEFMVTDIDLHADKILIRLENGSLIHLTLEMLNEEEIQSLKKKNLTASSTGGHITFSDLST